MKKALFFVFFILLTTTLHSEVQVGLDRVFSDPYALELKGKKIGLLTNLNAINSNEDSAFDLFYLNQKALGYEFKTAFAPEHGLDAKLLASDFVRDSQKNKIKVYSLHGKTRRPTDEMMEGLDLIIFDIQTVGVRCYTYETTLTYLMEKAAEHNIPVMVLDRPNPRGGLVVEGESMKDKYSCFFTYNKVPFCHGFTIGELARFVNDQQNIRCHLTVVPMTGWRRSMTYQQTGLPWRAPSPNIADPDTALVYPATILLGETLEIVSIDLNGEKPFKRFGAPWLYGQEFADVLNEHNLPGVVFVAENFKPKWGKYESELCGGVVIRVTHPERFQPLLTQYTIFEDLRRAYPDEFKAHLELAFEKDRKKACNYLTGSDSLMSLLETSPNLVQEMKLHESYYIQDFLKSREQYLIY